METPCACTPCFAVKGSISSHFLCNQQSCLLLLHRCIFKSYAFLFLCCVNMCQDVERTLLKCSGVGKASCQSWNWKAVVVVQRRGAWMPPALSAISECSDQRHWLRTWPHSNVTDKPPKAGQSVVISIIDYGLDLVAMSQTNLLKVDRVWWSGSLTTDLTSQQCHRQTS